MALKMRRTSDQNGIQHGKRKSRLMYLRHITYRFRDLIPGQMGNILIIQ